MIAGNNEAIGAKKRASYGFLVKIYSNYEFDKKWELGRIMDYKLKSSISKRGFKNDIFR